MRRRWWRAAAGLLVAALFVLLIGRHVAWADVRAVLASAEPAPLLLGLAALTADMGARIVRWWWMLRAADPDLPLGACVRPYLGSLALNNTVPLRAGDVVRVVGFRQALRVSSPHVLGTVVLERILDLLVLLAILAVGLLGTSQAFPRPFVAGAFAAGGVGLLALITLTLFPAAVSTLLGRLVAPLARGRAWGPGALRAVDQLAESLALLRAPGLALRLVGVSVLAWVLEGVVFASVAWSLHISVPPLAFCLTLGAATLATLLPSSPGYVGTFDYFGMLGLAAYGAARAEAAAFALLAHVMLWLPVTLAGFAALLLTGRPVAKSALRPDAA